MALGKGLEIFRNNVPIDTHQLQETITGRLKGDTAIIDIPGVVIHQDVDPVDAKALALFLNIGISNAGKILLRTQSNAASRAGAKKPTAKWIDNAIQETMDLISPIGKSIIIKASNKVMSSFINS